MLQRAIITEWRAGAFLELGSHQAQCPQGDSNARHRLRRPVLYPLSYGGSRAAQGSQGYDARQAQRECSTWAAVAATFALARLARRWYTYGKADGPVASAGWPIA